MLSALVLATMPHFFFLSHQAITDMYLVSNVVMAICMLMLGLATQPEARATQFRLWGSRSISLQAVVMFGIVMLAFPQILYLISRNIEFLPTEGFRPHPDIFLYGSGGNPGGLEAGQVPGNAEHRDVIPHLASFQPYLQGILWLLCLSTVIYLLRKETRAQSLYMAAFYVFCALAFMGKGIPGFALPGLIALLYLVALVVGRFSSTES